MVLLLYLMHKQTAFLRTLEEFERESAAISQLNDNAAMITQQILFTGQLNKCIMAGTYKDGLWLVKSIDSYLKKYGDRLSLLEKLPLYYKVATLYFGDGNYHKCIEYLSYIISVKRNYPKGAPFSLKTFGKQLLDSFWALAAVIIVVVGVVGGLFTATESAAIAVIYSLIVSVFIYKGITWKGVWQSLEKCVDTLAIVMILIAMSAAFGNCLTLLHVPAKAAELITSITSNRIVIILLLNLILLVDFSVLLNRT